ncbi:hypothetical protein E2C01_093808 [Portunus trituberculatus]|uniref:Uncharacterized protein n=1 Tax=Portunus trituberculatus TaxID=210409 RepID=A0A5B7JZ50_PORTR|nr:hypothetical protein [Portunus trituberculatus]
MAASHAATLHAACCCCCGRIGPVEVGGGGGGSKMAEWWRLIRLRSWHPKLDFGASMGAASFIWLRGRREEARHWESRHTRREGRPKDAQKWESAVGSVVEMGVSNSSDTRFLGMPIERLKRKGRFGFLD